MSIASAHELFVVPRASALPTGGNLYNEGLLAALQRAGAHFVRRDPQQLAQSALPEPCQRVWLDSLYLSELDALRGVLPRPGRFGLLLHALPSTLARAAGHDDAAWRARERALLAEFDCALVTSETTAQALAELAPRLARFVVQPAVRASASGQRAAARTSPVRAALIANLTPNKGVLAWLEALAAQVRADDAFMLCCVGRWDLDPAYAEACRRLTATPALAGRVVLTGVQTPDQVADELSRAHVLISPSRFESFGMAIADARASGVVVMARAGGHVAALVDAEAGGLLCDDDESLAHAFLSCVRDRVALSERLLRAAARPLAGRSWDEVARVFQSQVRAHAAGRKAQ